MIKQKIVPLFLIGILISACSSAGGLPGTGGQALSPTAAPAQATLTATPESAATNTPAATLPMDATQTALIQYCTLLNGQDVASFFTRAEVQLPVHKDYPVDHPVFSSAPAPGRESSCIFYGFQNPDKKGMSLLQITYWIDLPNPGSTASWDQAWNQLKSSGGTQVTGIGDGAYLKNSRRTLKKGNLYITVEATGAALQNLSSLGSDPAAIVEEKIAQDILSRIQ